MRKTMNAIVVSADTAGISLAANALREGKNVAFPTETVYGLGGNALNVDAVNRIFQFKGRPLTDPLIVHVSSKEEALPLVEIDSQALHVFNVLADKFWPGPLTMVMQANLTIIPNLVCAGTGFVGVRVPSHPIARNLIQEARVPVAAPSANRFGHVSPTSATHVLDDLGNHDIVVVDGGNCSNGSCSIGIESTVLKISNDNELVLFRKGGVSQAAIMETLKNNNLGHISIIPPGAKVVSEEESTQAPGQLLTHYAPDVDTWMIESVTGDIEESKRISLGDLNVPLESCVVIDFYGNLKNLKPAVLDYRDLSTAGDTEEAARHLFDYLRWTESTSAKHVLIQDVNYILPTDHNSPAVTDRMFRAASGKLAGNAKLTN